jgi:hypothetical protein
MPTFPVRVLRIGDHPPSTESGVRGWNIPTSQEVTTKSNKTSVEYLRIVVTMASRRVLGSDKSGLTSEDMEEAARNSEYGEMSQYGQDSVIDVAEISSRSSHHEHFGGCNPIICPSSGSNLLLCTLFSNTISVHL